MKLQTSLILVTGLAFMIYGVSCLTSAVMRSEFQRFGLERFRLLTGALEVLGGVGLMAGLRWPPILRISSGGLCLLMLLGLCVRLRSRDGLLLSLPAALFMVVNGFILKTSLGL